MYNCPLKNANVSETVQVTDIARVRAREAATFESNVGGCLSAFAAVVVVVAVCNANIKCRRYVRATRVRVSSEFNSYVYRTSASRPLGGTSL